ncbi:uncharacterized protein N7482_005212 [Penicillium canariense]|uniref:Uncharacterized protein n=1 Tax=Penicillium canariense TaxID=189055 RepID=A0A9W9I226_9EURO|nr:uncharacterized protein N7482_005212 [Penicillium canariense]KAJ5166431.1 hypothetical protein N7482_005212 [Penicillium canariense]
MASSSHGSPEAEVFPGRDAFRPRIQALNVEKEEQRVRGVDRHYWSGLEYTDRIGRKNDTPGPPVATWRSNLVRRSLNLLYLITLLTDHQAASSQRRNLLFVAHGCDIYVWVPSSPFQLLGSQAEMIIKPIMKNPLADGYIDRANPHTINNILVDELGRDEVLLLATDSGNVCGYHVEAIFSAVKRCARGEYKRPFDGAEVTPFFVENVGMSAWGLATHKFARLIAISANTGQITVYAFALVDPSPGDIHEPAPDSDSDGLNLTQSDQTWVSIHNIKQLRELQKLMPYNHRSRNLRLTYRGHFDNIPHISFANFDLDANGSWMSSTDISNRVIIWRIWDDLGPYRVYYPGHPMNNPPQRGWTVIPLDPRTFRRHQTKEDACGCQPGSVLIASRTILDVSRAIEDVPDASQIFVFGTINSNRPRNQDRRIESLPDDIFSPDCRIDRPSSPSLRPDCGHDRTAGDEPNAGPEGTGSISIGSSQREDKQSNTSHRVVRIKRPLASLPEEDSGHYCVSPCLHPDYSYDYEGFSDNNLKLFKERPVHPAHPAQFFPTIHFSEHHISMAPYPIDSDYHLLSRTPLFQRFSFNVEISSACDRFNMVKYVPELGIVVAASQKGRVAIISLTWQGEIGYAFRLDWILPFYTQERDDERPMIPLLGMAVSPMPGYEIPPDVPCIPRGVDPDDWLKFNYRILHPDEDDTPSSPSSITSEAPEFTSTAQKGFQSGVEQDSDSDSECPSESQSDASSSDTPSKPIKTADGHQKYTLPEIHAHASHAYRPQERWHGWHPSRHYRLLLLFCDHTVMSYEFWHDWKN